MSTKTRSPLDSTTSSLACGASSMFMAYWKPEHPPGTTRTRKPPSIPTFSASRNFLTSEAARCHFASLTPRQPPRLFPCLILLDEPTFGRDEQLHYRRLRF